MILCMSSKYYCRLIDPAGYASESTNAPVGYASDTTTGKLGYSSESTTAPSGYSSNNNKIGDYRI